MVYSGTCRCPLLPSGSVPAHFVAVPPPPPPFFVPFTVLSLGNQPPPAAAIASVATSPSSFSQPIPAVIPPLPILSSHPQLPVPIPSIRSHPPTLADTSNSAGGLLLSPAAEVIPKKLVDKIRSGRFVELKELLQDNMTLSTQLEEIQGTSTMQVVGISRPRLREISSLASWCHCYLAYTATLTADPITRDQLAYGRLIIQQAQSQGGLAFLDYDRAFRQQVATDASIRWNALNPSLLASTMLGRRSTGTPTFCTLCRSVDHNRVQCALAYFQSPPSLAAQQPQGGMQPPQRRPGRSMVCFGFNRGGCSYGIRCRYQHVCSNCSDRAHSAPNCPLARGSTPSNRPSGVPSSARVPGGPGAKV